MKIATVAITRTDGSTITAPAYKHHDSVNFPDVDADWVYHHETAGWVLVPHYRVAAVEHLPDPEAPTKAPCGCPTSLHETASGSYVAISLPARWDPFAGLVPGKQWCPVHGWVPIPLDDKEHT